TLRMVGDLLLRPRMGAGEVELVCRLSSERGFAEEHERYLLPPALGGRSAQSAALACLGDGGARMRVLAALASDSEGDVKSAQVCLAHHPVKDLGELRLLASNVATMSSPAAQVLAVESVARLRLGDPQSLDTLAALFPRARSLDVQRAIADL